ncbi:MAG: hypothetical protein HC796_08270 [Synechococcaceae cyanobacterium RL_1_2]|nr:hypothetical protein [Synechococcaceae cyanobacterium RL_1_2]
MVFSKGVRNGNVPIPHIPPVILYVITFGGARSSIKIKAMNNQLTN